MKKILLTGILSVSFFIVLSQNNEINDYTTIKYDNTITYGPVAHTNGLGLNITYLVNRSVYRNFSFNFDLLTLKHPKETRVYNPIYDDSKSYTYGKLNSVIVARPGFGNQFIIADKENPLGIRISASFSLGANFGLIKPEYLIIIHQNDAGRIYFVEEKYNPENPLHSNQGNIKGSAGFFKGFSDMTAAFGGYAKVSINFEWNEYEESFKALEAGVMVDAFPEELPIFAYIDNENYFINLYLHYKWGKRW